jgi:transposase InsO family protein
MCVSLRVFSSRTRERLGFGQDGEKLFRRLNEAIHKFGPPEIMNTDQGSQFTSFAWADRLHRAGVRISMDGKGRFLDNIFIERLWRPPKYECVYLRAWETDSEATTGITVKPTR